MTSANLRSVFLISTVNCSCLKAETAEKSEVGDSLLVEEIAEMHGEEDCAVIFSGLAEDVNSVAQREVNVASEFEAKAAAGADPGANGLGGPNSSDVKDGDGGE